jgi:hypothetical protein
VRADGQVIGVAGNVDVAAAGPEHLRRHEVKTTNAVEVEDRAGLVEPRRVEARPTALLDETGDVIEAVAVMVQQDHRRRNPARVAPQQLRRQVGGVGDQVRIDPQDGVVPAPQVGVDQLLPDRRRVPDARLQPGDRGVAGPPLVEDHLEGVVRVGSGEPAGQVACPLLEERV